jgi:uncharacterized protein (DUF1015 family)
MPSQATDPLGVVHRLWPVTDKAVIDRVRQLLRDQPVFIADGHHRYETSLNYQRELQESGKLTDRMAAPNFVMMQLVGMQDPGLQVLPTHRLLSGFPTVTTQELKHALESHFELEFIGAGAQAANDAWELVSADGSQASFGFGSAADGGWLFGRLTNTSPMANLAPDHSNDWQSLAVSRLHKLVIEHLLQNRYPAAEPKLRYVHQVSEVTAALKAEEAQIGCLVPPASIDHVELIASHRETMPPKSTYFYPKLLTGMVFHTLDQ